MPVKSDPISKCLSHYPDTLIQILTAQDVVGNKGKKKVLLCLGFNLDPEQTLHMTFRFLRMENAYETLFRYWISRWHCQHFLTPMMGISWVLIKKGSWCMLDQIIWISTWVLESHCILIFSIRGRHNAGCDTFNDISRLHAWHLQWCFRLGILLGLSNGLRAHLIASSISGLDNNASNTADIHAFAGPHPF